MKPALKLVSPVNPERQALAAALAEAKPAMAEIDRARTVAEAARNVLADAHAAVPAAERKVEAARASIVENPAGDRAALRAARQAVVDSSDDLEIAKQVASRATLLAADAERSARFANDRVEAAVNAVMAGCFEPALAAAEEAGREFARLAYAAQFIASNGNASNGDHGRMMGRVESLNAAFALRRDYAAVAAAQEQGEAPWLAARAALLRDADALLPEVK